MKTIFKARSLSWRSREKVTPHFAVVRHTERADATWQAAEWLQSAEGMKYPNDPPLSELGVAEAKNTGRQLVSMQNFNSADQHVVVTSPFMRCLQTAVEVCLSIGPSAVLLLDYGVGEVYGPDIFGECEPAQVLRPVRELHAYCRAHGVMLRTPAVGKMPTWPEFASQARMRFLDRFLRYLRRSAVSRRNFTLVTHSDGVAAALSAMPATKCRHVEHVGYGGFFVAILPEAHRRRSKSLTQLIPQLSSQSMCSVVPHESGGTDLDGVDGLDEGAPLSLNAACGWQVHVSSNVQLGPRVSEGLLQRISRWSHQTKISEKSIKRLLQFPKERIKESKMARQPEVGSHRPHTIEGEISPPWSGTPSFDRQLSPRSPGFGVRPSRGSVISSCGSGISTISDSTYVFGGSEFNGEDLHTPDKDTPTGRWTPCYSLNSKSSKPPAYLVPAAPAVCSMLQQEAQDDTKNTKPSVCSLSLSGSRLMQRRLEKLEQLGKNLGN